MKESAPRPLLNLMASKLFPDPPKMDAPSFGSTPSGILTPSKLKTPSKKQPTQEEIEKKRARKAAEEERRRKLREVRYCGGYYLVKSN